MKIFEDHAEQNPLDNTIDLGFKSDYRKYYTIDDPNLIQELFSLCYPTKTFHSDSRRTQQLILVVSDLYSCYKSGYDFVRYSRNENWYKGKSLSYSILIDIIKGLDDNGYLINKKGFQNGKMSRISRMKASEKFISLFKDVSLPQIIDIVPSEDDNYVILKGFKEQIEDRKKKVAQIIPFEQTDTTKTWNNFLFNYNTLLSNSNISLEEGYIPKENINFDRVRVYRQFNDESFEKGGRLYGPWFQNSLKETRQHILINGVSSVEVDYSCMHPTLAYALNGIDTSEKDLYAVDTIENYQDHRKTIKKVVNICLNAKNKRSAIGAINNESLKHPKYTSTELVDLCTSYHSKISNMFFSDSGKRFMFEDSEISIQILQHYMEQNIIVLPVHDSFIISKEHEQDLTSYMIQAFLSRTGKRITVESKKPIYNNTNNTNNLSSFSSFLSPYNLPEAHTTSSITHGENNERTVFLLTHGENISNERTVFLLTHGENISTDECLGFFETDDNEQPIKKDNTMSLREIFEAQTPRVQKALLKQPREAMEDILRKMETDPTFFSEDDFEEEIIEEEITPETEKERIHREDKEFFEECNRNYKDKFGPVIIDIPKDDTPRYLEKYEKETI